MRVSVAIVGDIGAYARAIGQAIGITEKFGASQRELSVDTQKLAGARVEASLKTTARLRDEVAAYRTLAGAAKRGSEEQVAAAQLADRAQRRLSEAIGVTASESRRLAVSSGHVERDVGRATRGALAGTGVFHSLGRSIAFASGGFLAFAGGGQFLEGSIRAARDAEVTQRQLATQLKASGLVFGQWKGQIDQTDLALSHLAGYTTDQLERSLTVLVRGTGDVNQALNLNAVAANIARGRHVDLTVAATALAKAYNGQSGALSRLIGGLPKGVTGMAAITVAAQRYAGQAAAGTTVQQRFATELHDSEIIIGQALLPTLDRYLAKGATWLDQMNRSGRLQHDVATAAHDVGTGLHDAHVALTPLVQGFRLLGDAVGGTENELKLIAGTLVVLKARMALANLGLLSIGSAAEGSAAKVAGLRGGLLGLAGKTFTAALVLDIATNMLPQGKGLPNPVKGVPIIGSSVGFGEWLGELLTGQPQIASTQAQLGHKGLVQLPSGEWVKAGSVAAVWGSPAAAAFGSGPASDAAAKNARAAARRITGNVAAGTALSPADKLALGLALHPDDVTLLRQKARQDQQQLAQLERERKTGQLTEQAFMAQAVPVASELHGIEATLATQTKKGETAAAKRAREAAAAARKAAQQHLHEVATREQELRNALAQTARQDSGRALTKSRSDAYDALIEFYKQEAGDSKLTQEKRQYFKGLAIAARGKEISEAARDADAYERTVIANAKALYTKSKGVKGDIAGQEAALRKLIRVEGGAMHDKALTPEQRATFGEQRASSEAALAQLRNTFVVPLTIQVDEAKAAALNDSAGMLTAAKEARAAAMKAIKSGVLGLQGMRDAWDIVAQANQTIGTGMDGYVKVSAERLAATVTGLDKAQRAAVAMRYASVLAHGGRVPTGPAALGVPTGVHTTNIVVNVHESRDARATAKAVLDELQKHGRRNAPTRTGRHGGYQLALT